MAFIDTKSKSRDKYNENGDKLIVLRLSIENSLRYIVYATVSNIFVKKKNLVNLERFVNLIDVEASYSEEDIDAKHYFLLLRVIIRMINRNEVSTLEILSDHLITEYGDKEISTNKIHQAIDTIDHAMAMEEDDDSESYLSENEVLSMNSFIEIRISYSFLNERIPELTNLTRDLAEGKVSDSRVVENAEELITDLHADLVKTRTSSDIEDNTINFASRENSESVIERYIDRLRSPDNRLKTGYKGLNRMLNGGLQEKRLYVFLGTPKSFKSGTLLNIALSVAEHNYISKAKSLNRKPVVLYYSMENDSVETLDRMFFYYFGKSISEVDMTREEIVNSIYKATQNKTGVGVIVKYAPSNSVNTDHLYDTMDELREQGFETICLVQDYLRRIRPAKKAQENYLMLGNVVDELSVIAKVTNIPVITASQLNREATNIREHCIKQNVLDIASQMFISHIAESTQVQQNLDVGIIVAREEVVKYDEFGNKSSNSYLGFKLVADRDGQKAEGNEGKLEYFALPFENGFKIAQDEDTDKELWSESVARASMSDEEFKDMEERRERVAKKMNQDYQNRSNPLSSDSRIPSTRTTVVSPKGQSTEMLGSNRLNKRLRETLDPNNDI